MSLRLLPTVYGVVLAITIIVVGLTATAAPDDGITKCTITHAKRVGPFDPFRIELEGISMKRAGYPQMPREDYGWQIQHHP